MAHSLFKIPIGQREVKLSPEDLEEKLDSLGITKTGERAEEKWAETAEAKETAKAMTSIASSGYTEREEYIDPEFFSLDFKIHGKVFHMAVEHILRIKQEDRTDPSVETINTQLEACSYYRFSFFAAAQQVKLKRQEVEREFRQWMAKQQESWRDLLPKERKKFRERHSLTSKDQPSITKDEILDAILTGDCSKEYERFHHEIDVLKQKEELLIELRDCLHDRGFHLGGIADRMSQHRKKGDF